MSKFFVIIRRKINDLINKTVWVILNPKRFIVIVRDLGRVQKILDRNRELKDRFKGKRCFVVGNGSSLNKMNLKVLKKEYTFVVNNFIVHKDFSIIKPKFYMCIEPIESILTLPINDYYHPDNFYRLIEKTVKKTGTTLFFLVSSQQYINDKSLFKSNNKYYLNPGVSILAADKFGYEDDITKRISFCDSVIPAAICTAAYMGFNEIYLIGCDEDQFFVDKNYYFYKGDEKAISQFKKELTMEQLAYKFSLSFKRWRLLRDHFITKEVNIINAGIGSKLDVFSRVNFNELLSNK